jgi:hypothetical protein
MTPRARRLKRKYGISIRQYDEMLALQLGVCAICHFPPKSRRLHVDHDHATKRVRGLLCFTCNRFLVSKNNVETARQVLWYLSRAFDARKL